MVAKPLYPLYKNIIKPLDRVRYPELRSLLLTFFLAPIGWVSVVLMFICCACLFGIGSPEQFLIVKHAKGGEMLGGCCIQGAFNLGNAMGAFLGGIPVAIGLGYNFPALIGVPMALAGAICLLVFHKKYE